MKKKIIVTVAVILVLVLAGVLAACKEDRKTESGRDAYGRSYGEVYPIDSEATGVFSMPYSIGDTSAIGKTMISANCADYAEAEKTADGYKFTFLCKDGMLGGVKMVKEDGSLSGVESQKDGYQRFTFDVTKEELQQKISLECVVKLMNKTVSFSVTVDLTQAKLVG